MEIVIASQNIHKIREFRFLLKPLKNLEILSLLDFPDYIPEDEIGETFEEIASKKALHAAQALHRWVLADDSGLVVTSLNGRPGILSARYAPTDKEKRAKLLQELIPFPDMTERHAYFECCLAIASPEEVEKTVSAVCEGAIGMEEKGSHGFGYDPLFIKHDYSKTFGEIDEEIKNRISHRRKAFDKILPYLEQL